MRQVIGKDWNERGHRHFTRSPTEPFPTGMRKQAVSKGNKSYLPSKDCATCGLPFSWRKKWERCWDEVKYCSDRCRRNKSKET